MKNLLLALILTAPSIALSAKNDGWCDASPWKKGVNYRTLVCASPYWVTTGQYFIDNNMDKSVDDIMDNTFIDCWWMQSRARIIRKHNYRNFRVAQQRWSLYEVEYKGYQGYVTTGVCK